MSLFSDYPDYEKGDLIEMKETGERGVVQSEGSLPYCIVKFSENKKIAAKAADFVVIEEEQ